MLGGLAAVLMMERGPAQEAAAIAGACAGAALLCGAFLLGALAKECGRRASGVAHGPWASADSVLIAALAPAMPLYAGLDAAGQLGSAWAVLPGAALIAVLAVLAGARKMVPQEAVERQEEELDTLVREITLR